MRHKPPSNRFKRLRRLAQALGDGQNKLTTKWVEVVMSVPDVVVTEIQEKRPVVANHRARKFKNRYRHHIVQTRKAQPFWQDGTPRRIYKDMKRDGWGGTLSNLERLVGGHGI